MKYERRNVLKNLMILAVAAVGIGFLPQKAEAVSARERALVIVTDLDTHGASDLRDLYRILEDIGVGLPNLPIIRDTYKEIVVLRNQRATLADFKETMRSLAVRQDILAIDAFVMLHGSPGKLHFADQSWEVSEMVTRFNMATTPQERVARIFVKKKARLVYNTSCFGKSHNQAFLDMGFAVSVGSKGVNANSEVEYPSFLALWTTGSTVEQALAPTNSDFAIGLADGPILAYANAANKPNLKKTNSKKVILGNEDIRITSSAFNN